MSHNEGAGLVKIAVAAVVLAALFLVGCGNSVHTAHPPASGSTGDVLPPRASLIIGNQQIPAVINGYQWSDGAQTVVADAATDPAKNLKKYDATPGQRATLSFRKKPKSVQITMWANGKQALTSKLSGPSFSLPSQAGDYTYEVTGHWGKEYVNYDFNVQVQ